MITKEREYNVDILRILAFSFVIGVHSMLYNGFYSEPTIGLTMLSFNILRCLFICCCPIFMVITGYLLKNKTLNKNYVYKLSRVLVSYLVASVFCEVAFSIIYKRSFNFVGLFRGIYSFSKAPYSWYINMYIGLYFFAPFLNLAYNGLKDQKHRKYLLIILFCFIVLPTLTNIWQFNIDFILSPPSVRDYNFILPMHWTGVAYPLIYYFVGCYLKDYGFNISKKWNIFLLIVAIPLFGLFNYYRSNKLTFDDGIYVGYYSFEAFTITLLLSNLILKHTKCKFKYNATKKIVTTISNCTLTAYLISAVFDEKFYPILLSNTSNMFERLVWGVPLFICIWCLSIFFAYLLSFVEKLIIFGLDKLKPHIKRLIETIEVKFRKQPVSCNEENAIVNEQKEKTDNQNQTNENNI